MVYALGVPAGAFRGATIIRHASDDMVVAKGFHHDAGESWDYWWEDYVLEPLEQGAPPECAPSATKDHPEAIFGLALSGGGSRAAVFGAAAMEALWEHGLLEQESHLHLPPPPFTSPKSLVPSHMSLAPPKWKRATASFPRSLSSESNCLLSYRLHPAKSRS